MKFKLVSPSATMNIVLSRREIRDLINTGRVFAEKEDRAELYHTMFEENDTPFIQFLNICTEDAKIKNDDPHWHPCSYENGKLKHDGSWKPGCWYEWIDRCDNVRVARMKDDAEDHFWPSIDIKEEDVMAFRKIKGVKYDLEMRFL